MVKSEKEQLKEKQFLWANKRSFITPNHVAEIIAKYFILLIRTKTTFWLIFLFVTQMSARNNAFSSRLNDKVYLT